MISRSFLYFLIAFLLNPLIIYSDTIFLKNGREIKVNYAWEENNQIMGTLYGTTVAFNKDEVLRVEYEKRKVKKSNKKPYKLFSDHEDYKMINPQEISQNLLQKKKDSFDSIEKRILRFNTKFFKDDDKEILKKRQHIHEGNLYFGNDPKNPEIGDIRLRYECVRPKEVSIIAKQYGNLLTFYETKKGDKIEILYSGKHSSEDMFQQKKYENAVLTWAMRFGGFILFFLGFAMIFKSLPWLFTNNKYLSSYVTRGYDLFSLFLSIIFTLMSISIIWLTYKPIISLILIGASFIFLCLLLLIGKPEKKKEEPKPVDVKKLKKNVIKKIDKNPNDMSIKNATVAKK